MMGGLKGGFHLKKKVALTIAAVAGSLALLVPVTSSAAPKTCVEVNGPHGFHLQIGYAPNGPASCKQLP